MLRLGGKFMTKINPIGLFSKLKTKIKKPAVIDSIQNTAEAIRIIRECPPEEIRKIVFREANPLINGNTELVAKLNRFMSKKLAQEVYKNV